jgi:hypothetical protein
MFARASLVGIPERLVSTLSTRLLLPFTLRYSDRCVFGRDPDYVFQDGLDYQPRREGFAAGETLDELAA